MRTFKNTVTGEVVTIPRIKNVGEGFMSNDGTKVFAQSFIARWSAILSHDLQKKDGVSVSVFSLRNGWQELKKERKSANKASEKKEKAQAKRSQRKAVEKAQQEKENEGQAHEQQKPGYSHPMLQTVIKLLQADRRSGRFPFLHGPAGSGKSTLAQKAAEALNLPFYSVSSLQQKYELEGYTDAVGKYVETSFYHAFKYGGVFCFDELTTSPGEVLIAFNTACAQLIYNFPKEGLIRAHKDFHIIACDNTTGTGKSSSYTARFILDASTRDRFTLIEVGYTRSFDLFMSQNDADLCDFCEDLREALKLSDMSQYLASPRALQAFCSHILDFSLEDSLRMAFFGGWSRSEMQTIAAAMQKKDNKYFKVFQKLAK